MTISTYAGGGALAPAPSGGSLTGYLADYQQASELMRLTIDTPWVPDAFRPQAFLPKNERPTQELAARARETAVAAGAVAIVYGRSIGFDDPFSALQNVYVVGGRPGLYAAAMVAIVQAAGHDIWTEDITDTRAVVCGRRKGVEQVERVIVTMDQARKAGWTRNQKYTSEPQAMLWARAASTVCRRVAQDALKGMTRSVEELHDDVTVTVEQPTRTVQRAVQPAAPRPQLPAPAAPAPVVQHAHAAAPGLPPLPGEEPSAPVRNDPEPTVAGSSETGEAISERTVQQINTLFVRGGVTGPGQTEKRKRVIEHIVQRPVSALRDLTEAEGATVAERLHHGGRDLIGTALAQTGFQGEPQPPSTPAPTAEPAPPVPGDEFGGADPSADGDYDPTTEAGWARDEAAAEA